MNNTMTPPDGKNDSLPIQGGKADRQQLGAEKNDDAKLMTPSMEGHTGDEPETTSGNNYSKKSVDVTPEKADIFEDLAALGRPVDEIAPSEKVLTSMAVRKPTRDEWVRLHPEIHTRLHVYEDKTERSWYVVLPEFIEPLLDVARYVQMSLAVNYAGSAFVWPVPIPTERKPHQAHVSAFAAAAQGMREWIRISWGGSDYDVYRRRAATAEPVWPDEISNASEMLRFAARAGGFEVIDSMDHPVVRGHLGLD